MSFVDRLLLSAAKLGIFGIVVLLIAAAVLVTWWQATEGAGPHENTQR